VVVRFPVAESETGCLACMTDPPETFAPDLRLTDVQSVCIRERVALCRVRAR
jgi:hypothetical protein